MPKPFGRRMFDRTLRAYEREDQYARVITHDAPILEEAVSSNARSLEAFRNLLKAFETQNAIIAAVSGRMSETAELAEEQANELAHLAMFIQSMDVYYAHEPETVKHSLEIVSPEVWQQALEEMSEEKFNELQRRMELAQAGRYRRTLESEES